MHNLSLFSCTEMRATSSFHIRVETLDFDRHFSKKTFCYFLSKRFCRKFLFYLVSLWIVIHDNTFKMFLLSEKIWEIAMNWHIFSNFSLVLNLELQNMQWQPMKRYQEMSFLFFLKQIESKLLIGNLTPIFFIGWNAVIFHYHFSQTCVYLFTGMHFFKKRRDR